MRGNTPYICFYVAFVCDQLHACKLPSFCIGLQFYKKPLVAVVVVVVEDPWAGMLSKGSAPTPSSLLSLIQMDTATGNAATKKKGNLLRFLFSTLPNA